MVVVDSFLVFFSLSDHVTLLFLIQSSSYIKDRLRNLTSFFNFSILGFLNFRAFFFDFFVDEMFVVCLYS